MVYNLQLTTLLMEYLNKQINGLYYKFDLIKVIAPLIFLGYMYLPKGLNYFSVDDVILSRSFGLALGDFHVYIYFNTACGVL